MVDPARLRRVASRPRVFIVSDISNEPDDAQSLVRLLLYANELDIVGLVACTSCWMRRKVRPEDMHAIVRAYGRVVGNLNAHVHPDNQYPSEAYLQSIIKPGPPVYGREALAEGYPLSEGARLLIDAADDATTSETPLWVLSWGGVNVLAQALQHVHATRSPAAARSFRARLRVYTISDQDDCGHWIRVNYPDILYICSLHAWGEYGCATWTGISGDVLMKSLDTGGPDTSLVTKEWLAANIQTVGSPLGEVYPDASFIMEGDTPTFLYLIQNGLGVPEQPSWGSWGGRYGLVDLGGSARHYADVKDTVTGKDGKMHRSGQASIWRWREAYQGDFAARMQWTLTADREKASHAPVVVVNDSSAGAEAYYIDAEAGSELVLDASRSYSPDHTEEHGGGLTFEWYHYKEPTTTGSLVHWPSVPDVEFVPSSSSGGSDKANMHGSVVKVAIPAPETCAVDILTGQPLQKGQVLHFILTVKSSGTGAAIRTTTTYKRLVVQVTNRAGRGGRDLAGRTFDTVTEALGFSTGQERLEEGSGR
ncbi:hypothetical protein Micbo1qcDRAFT_227242 [Microdochium bolleyi]|uniref:Cellulose-binding protein n=1 Tax=Microdochium bolleyi TaxID=196109 RepID=A0A136IYY2_9PEZI|nr:hypothetical protein Micbo1qcDRAFT_227242 [Microdochium bolleyi]